MASKLVIPNSISYYTECPIGDLDESDIESEIQEHLTSTTPFQLNEVAYDWYVQGNVAKIAYVFRQNLDEAEAFAIEWNLNPIYCEAHPPPGTVFQRRAFFGLTRFATKRKCVAEVVKAQAIAMTEPDPITRSAWVGNGQARRNALSGVAGVVGAFALAFVIGVWGPAAEAVGIDGSSTEVVKRSAEPTERVRLAQVTEPLRIQSRPARRPLKNKSGQDVVDLRPDTSVDGVGVVSHRELVDRGFDPSAIRSELLTEFRLGATDTAQADMVARIRGTAPLISPFNVGIRTQPDSGTAAESEPVPAYPNVTPESEIRQQLLANLEGNKPASPVVSAPEDLNEQIVGAILELQQSPTDPAPATRSPSVAVSYIEVPSQRPRRRNLAQTVSAESTGTSLGLARPLRRPVEASSTRIARANSSGATDPVVVGSSALRHSDGSETSNVEAVRIARGDPQIQRSPLTTPRDDPFSYVLSQANETITIDEGGVTLIGIYGSESDLRALVRSGSGKISALTLGSEYNGGRVVEIRLNAVIFEVRGNRVTLSQQ